MSKAQEKKLNEEVCDEAQPMHQNHHYSRIKHQEEKKLFQQQDEPTPIAPSSERCCARGLTWNSSLANFLMEVELEKRNQN